jgi:hypothetical protein
MTTLPRREDIFVSVCFPTFPAGAGAAAKLQALSQRLSERFRYCEILLIVYADAATDYDELMKSSGNLRLLTVRRGTPVYRRRVAAASEAIGDVVAMAAIEEQPALDLLAMIETAHSESSIVIGRRVQQSRVDPALHVLGRSAGFRVNAGDMLTAAYPRTLLNNLLTHPNSQLALRFPPSDAGIPVLWQDAVDAPKPARSLRGLGRRLGIVQKLLISSAPRVLTLVALCALVVTFSGFAFTVYSVIVLLFQETVQQGWFTISLVLSLTAAFLGAAIFGISIGLQKLIEALGSDGGDDIVGERSAVDLFGQVMREFNVDTSAAPHFPSLVARIPSGTFQRPDVEGKEPGHIA